MSKRRRSVQEKIGNTAEKAGRPKASGQAHDNIMSLSQGTSAAYWAARLLRREGAQSKIDNINLEVPTGEEPTR